MLEHVQTVRLVELRQATSATAEKTLVPCPCRWDATGLVALFLDIYEVTEDRRRRGTSTRSDTST